MPSVGSKRVNIRDDLYEYLKERAERNFRQPNAELNAILVQLRDEDAQEDATAKVVKLEPVEDQAPRGPHGTISGYIGVYRYGKRWQARITRGGQTTRIGVFDDPEEAALAFDTAVRESGSGERLNFPTEKEQQMIPQLGQNAPLPPELQKIKDETEQIITRQAGSDIDTANLPPALRRGLAAHGHTVPPVEDSYEPPDLEPAEPDIDPDPGSTPA